MCARGRKGVRRSSLQGPAADRRGSAVAVGPRQRQRARADLGQRPGAADRAAKGQIVTAVECERRVIDDIADDRPGGPAAPDLQRPGADRRAAAVGVGPRQRQRARPGLGERANAGDGPSQRRVVAIGVEGATAGIERHAAVRGEARKIL